MTRPLTIVILLCACCFTVSAQTKKNAKPVKRPVVSVPAPAPTSTPVALPEPAPKKNERPADVKANGRDGKNSSPTSKGYTPVYFYDFDRPGFVYSHIAIEYDENGKGQISFKKDGYDDVWSDPLQLTPVTLAGLKAAFSALNFIDSTESYQFPTHDYSNMGNVTITLKQAGRVRTAKYNWTENKDAKFLMDEYRRISNEYTWHFEMLVARENQPLQTPGLMDAIASYLDRSEISDPPHLVPFLTELSTDERLPLMARNRAAKLIAQINKAKK